MIEGTVAAWIESLTFNRVWDQGRDTPRIRYAFRVLGANLKRWPSPSDLTDHLPDVASTLALPAKVADPKVAEANIEKIKRMLRGEE